MPRLYNNALPLYVSQEQARGDYRAARPASVDLSGVLQAANVVIDQVREDNKVRASERLASAHLQWVEAEQKGEQEYDPATGKPYAKQALRAFDDYSMKVIGKAANPDEGEILRRRFALMRPGVGERAMRFENAARITHRTEVLGKTLNDRQAAAALDPSQALDLIAQQAAEVNSSDLSPPARAALLDQAKAGIAYSAAQTVALMNPQGLKDHPVFRYLPADKLPGLLRAAQGSELMARAQSAADGIMARGIPLDEAMRSIERDHAGEDERALKAEVLSRYSYAEKARADAQQEVYGTAQLEVERGGRVTPGTWAKLTDAHRAAILNRQQAEARQRRLEAAGTPVRTDFGLYLELREQAIAEPEKFATTDLRQYVDKIGGAQLEQLIDLKGRVVAAGNKAPKAPKETVTLTQQMNATMQALRIRKPEQKGQFISFVQSEIDDATQANGGKPLTFDQRQQVIDRAVLKGPDPDAWAITPGFMVSDRRMFELTPDQRQRFKPEAATDAPAAEIQALNEALQQQGLPQTPANRLALYARVRGGAR